MGMSQVTNGARFVYLAAFAIWDLGWVRAGQGWGWLWVFFRAWVVWSQTRGGLSMVDWDRYRGGFGGGWAVSWFVNAMQGHCNVNPIFCLLGDFVLLLISSFEFVGMGNNMTRKKKL